MRKKFHLIEVFWGILFLLNMGQPGLGFSQQPNDEDTKTNIIILNNEYGEYIQGATGSVHKLMYHVKLRHGSDTLYCDSAFFYQQQNSVEAFGNVAIYQADGTTAFANYMRYTGNNRKVFMRGTESDAELSDGKGNNLWSKEIYYDLTTKIGTYRRGGVLQSEQTIVSSRSGSYNLNTKDARFKENVEVSDPDYHVISEDLGYNTQTKVVRFFAPSVVTNDASILQTSNGIYDTRNKSGHFVDRSSILNKGQYIEADTLDYDRSSGRGIATGHVIAIDTAKKTTLYCNKAIYNEITGELLSYGRPVMKMIHDDDKLFIKADTFFSAPIPEKDSILTAADSLQITADQIHDAMIDPGDTTRVPAGKRDSNDASFRLQDSAVAQMPPMDSLNRQSKDSIDAPVSSTAANPADTIASDTSIAAPDADSLGSRSPLLYMESAQDTTLATTDTTAPLPLTEAHQYQMDSTSASYENRPAPGDSSRPRYFVGYHHVRIFSDSLQGKCDSIRYTQTDSLLKMYRDPVLWPGNRQILGEEIHLRLEENTIRSLYVPRHGIIISQSGPEKAGMYNQIQGNSITAYFTDNQLDSLIAEPNASNIYFVTNDAGAYVGASKASSEQIRIFFKKGAITKIYYRQDVTQTMTPMKAVIPTQLHLSRFRWRGDEKATDLNHFLEGASLPHAPELFRQPSSQEQPQKEVENIPGKPPKQQAPAIPPDENTGTPDAP